jgi:tetratricopeptide (TPR) repeat protein
LQVNIGEAHADPLPPAFIGWMSHAWPFDPRLARALPTDNDYAAALQNLDAALLHNPKSVLAWYLRGYLLQTKNRADLSLRDFRRMAAMEAEDRELRHKRILALELVQGSLRQGAYRIEQRALIDVGDEWTLRVLRESPAAPDITK